MCGSLSRPRSTLRTPMHRGTLRILEAIRILNMQDKTDTFLSGFLKWYEISEGP